MRAGRKKTIGRGAELYQGIRIRFLERAGQLSLRCRIVNSEPRPLKPLPRLTIAGSDRRISRVGLGTMLLSIEGRPDRDRAKAVIRTAVEEGLTLIDTADVYALDDSDIGHGERLVAEALREMGLRVDGATSGDREAVVVATKGGRTRPGGRWGHDARPERLREACHASLRALGAELIPLYQLHAPDPDVPFEESVGALARLREEGKVGAVGLSNVSADELNRAREIVPIASVQNSVSIWDIGYRRSPILEACEKAGIVLLGYSPLGGRSRAKELTRAPEVEALGRELGASAQELALAWFIARSPVLVPLPGARRVETARSCAKSASMELDPSTLKRLTRAFRRLPGQRGIAERILDKLRGLGRR